MSLCWGGLRRIHVLLSSRGKRVVRGGIQDRKRGTDMNAKTAVKNNSSLGAGLRKANSIKQQEASHSPQKAERDTGADAERGLNRHQVGLCMSAAV